MIRLIVLIGISLFGIQSFAQDSTYVPPSFKSEFSTIVRIGFHFETAIPRLNDSELPSFFPVADKQGMMTLEKSSYVSSSTFGLSYTKWFNYSKKNSSIKYGAGFFVGTNDGYYFNEYWNNRTRITFDSVVSQSNGTKYPVDSVFHHFYERKTVINPVQIGISGYHLNQYNERFSVQFGIRAILSVKAKENTYFKYLRATSIESYGQHYEVSKEKASVISETNLRTDSPFMNFNVSFPYTFNFSLKRNKSKSLEMKKRNRKESKALIYFFGIEPLINVMSINGTTYSRINFSFVYGGSIRF